MPRALPITCPSRPAKPVRITSTSPPKTSPTAQPCSSMTTPPIRSRADREALWQGLRDGSIDLIATGSFSACPPQMKRASGRRPLRPGLGWHRKPICCAAGCLDGRCEAAALRPRRGSSMDVFCSGCALAGFGDRVGSLAPGRDASFVVFDPEAEFVVTPEKLTTLSPRHFAVPAWASGCTESSTPPTCAASPSIATARSSRARAAASSRYARQSASSIRRCC